MTASGSSASGAALRRVVGCRRPLFVSDDVHPVEFKRLPLAALRALRSWRRLRALHRCKWRRAEIAHV